MNRVTLRAAVALFLVATLTSAFSTGLAEQELRGLWRLPAEPPSPNDNKLNPRRAELGKMLFFDPRLSMSRQVTCASCHLPERAWADGLPTAVRFLGTRVPVATPSLVNVGYNSIFMWDGRQPSLEHQALGGQGPNSDINAGGKGSPEDVIQRIRSIAGYRSAFDKAYPGEGISGQTIAKALASFQRTLNSTDSPFDRWVRGDSKALTEQQLRGFAVFRDNSKGACVNCHQAPNFTDNGFHNIGLKSYGDKDAHPGRGRQVNSRVFDGAFKTPSLRDVSLSAPYFHDGSARTLGEVVDHYVKGGDVKTNLSPLMKPALLSPRDRDDLLAFLESLASPTAPFTYPVLPASDIGEGANR